MGKPSTSAPTSAASLHAPMFKLNNGAEICAVGLGESPLISIAFDLFY